MVTRRDILRAGVGVVAGALLPSTALTRKAPADFTFVVANDLHYRDARCGEWMERVVASIRALKPRPGFVVLNGDLSDLGTREQLGAMREIFKTLPMPVHSTIGNHDYTEDNSRQEYEALFGAHRNFRFNHADWQFAALDTTDGRSVYRTWVHGETLGWLDANLPGVSHDRPLVVFSHFPLGRNWLRPLNAGSVISRLKGYDVKGVFGGHWHGLTERQEGDMHFSTGRCCSWWRENHDGSDEKGYFLCHVRGGEIEHQFVPVRGGPGTRTA